MTPNPLHSLRGSSVVKLMGGLTVVLLIAAMLIGLASLQGTQKIVADDFSRQQLILARSMARQLGEALHQVERELTTLGYSPSVQYLERVSWANRMRLSMEELRRYGAESISRYGADGRTRYVLGEDGEAELLGRGPEADAFWAWSLEEKNRGRIFHGPVTGAPGPTGLDPVMTVAMPIYQVSVDESHPVATGRFDGVVAITLRVNRLVERFAADIHSGHTGYAWVLSETGVFLYHPDATFVGRDAFTARHQRNPAISFDAINAIQKTRMLRGGEGCAVYTSGWHRGVTGEMKKFLAFSPVEVDPGRYWSVAVVAPTDEVSGTVRTLYTRQFFIQGV
ncbi:MAG: cache domain-containing protein, partial [Pseudomonadota bacterium]